MELSFLYLYVKKYFFTYTPKGEHQMENLCYNLDGYDPEFNLMKEKHNLEEKEYLVLKEHKNKITPPNEKYSSYRTRASWCPSGRLIRKSYEEIINALYEHYFGISVNDLTFAQAIEEMTETRLKNKTISFNTAKHYLDDSKKYIPSALANKPIVSIKKSHIINYFDDLIGDGSLISKKTVSNIKTIFNKTFDFINLRDDMTVIDCKSIRISDMTRRCITVDNSNEVYDRDEIEALNRFLDTIEPNVYSCAIQLLTCLTIRVGELRALKWTDIDYENRQISLEHSMVSKNIDGRKESQIYVNYMKAHSKSGKRKIDLSDYALYILSKLQAINGNNEYIFQSGGKKPVSTNKINAALEKYCNEIGIRYRSTHKIRFYTCSTLYENGIDENTIRYYMGHSSIGMTRHYDRRKVKRLTTEEINKTLGFSVPEKGLTQFDPK